LIGDKVDLLPRLLLPLAGPEEFDDDDMEKLPEDFSFNNISVVSWRRKLEKIMLYTLP
jgi:hypothetical protein